MAENLGGVWSREVLEIMVSTGEDLSADRVLRLSRGDPVSLEVLAVEDGLAEPRETVGLSLSGSSQYTRVPVTAEMQVVIPRHGYTVRTMTVTASTVRPSDEFEVELLLNAPLPSGMGASMVQMTVLAFVRDTAEVASSRTVSIRPGESSGRTTIYMTRVSTYTLSISDPVFTHAQPGDQRELEVEALDQVVSVHALMDYNNSARGEGTRYGQVEEIRSYFQERPEGFRVPAGAGFCTEEARTTFTLESRLPCLDVTDDGYTDLLDLEVIYQYLRTYQWILQGLVPKNYFLFSTELYDALSDEEVDLLIENVQGTYPRTPPICRAFQLEYCD